MIKQTKKRFAAILMLVFLSAEIIGFPVYALTPNAFAEEQTVSEIAEQKSVIDEQAMMLQSASVPSALNDSVTLVLENSNITRVGEGYTEEEPVEIKNNEVEDINTDSEILSPYYDLIESLTDDEKYLIYQITFLEAGNQSIDGQRAVIEVILNRVLSDKYPDTVEGVLSQSGQFTTWSCRNCKSHNKEQEDALELVYTKAPMLTLDYLMFSRGKFSWGKNYIKLGDHWFGTF